MSEAQAAPSQTIRVILVEDHVLTRIGLKTVIDRTEDLKVVGEATDGEESIAMCRELCPDVVLMDVGLPVMDGIEAARRIREDNKDVAIIMLTSHDSDGDIFASLAAGASGYCLKDVEPHRLYTAIRTVSAGDVWLDAHIAGRVIKQYAAESTVAGTETGRPLPVSRTQQDLPEPLSPRELEVLNLLVEGLSNQEIADQLIISLATAKTHVRNILNKLSVDDRTQAAVSAMRRGLV